VKPIFIWGLLWVNFLKQKLKKNIKKVEKKQKSIKMKLFTRKKTRQTTLNANNSLAGFFNANTTSISNWGKKK